MEIKVVSRDERLFKIILHGVFLYFFVLCLGYGNFAMAQNTSVKIIPLPIYSTLPNEGSTFGFMPVFLTVDDQTQHTLSIIAPSVSWNRTIQYTSTFRMYLYPSLDETINIIPSISSNINRALTLEYFNLPRQEGGYTREAFLHFRRSLFYRFFGIGPQTKSSDETSYTRLGGEAGFRIGKNITRSLNIGFRAQLERELVEKKHIAYLPLSSDVYPGAPGMGGATNFFEGFSIRYDTRELHEYSPQGFESELRAGYVEGLSGSKNFARIQGEMKGMWEETSQVQGAARAFWSYTPGSGIPFFDQSSLGGSYVLRGFTEDRFIDKGAWEAEIEQRITFLRTHIYGVETDWRVDPFIAVGQVYADTKDFFRYAKISGGLGFRAFVHPNIVGRVDTAVGGEGIKVYVELGYPF